MVSWRISSLAVRHTKSERTDRIGAEQADTAGVESEGMAKGTMEGRKKGRKRKRFERSKIFTQPAQ